MILNIEYLLRWENPTTGEIKYVEKFDDDKPVYTLDRGKALHYDTEVLARSARDQYKLRGVVNAWPIKLN